MTDLAYPIRRILTCLAQGGVITRSKAAELWGVPLSEWRRLEGDLYRYDQKHRIASETDEKWRTHLQDALDQHDISEAVQAKAGQECDALGPCGCASCWCRGVLQDIGRSA